MKKRIAVVCLVALGILSISGIVAVAGGFIDSDILNFFRSIKEGRNDKTVAATVNGEPIYKSSVKFMKGFYKLSTALSTKQINEMDIPDEEKQVLLEKLANRDSQKTDKQILEDLIKQKVVLQEAHKKGITVSDDQAYQYAKEQLELCKKAGLAEDATEEDKENYEFMLAYMEEMQLTEAEYINEAKDAYKNMMERALLYNDFKEAYLQNGGDENELENAMESYENELIKKQR